MQFYFFFTFFDEVDMEVEVEQEEEVVVMVVVDDEKEKAAKEEEDKEDILFGLYSLTRAKENQGFCSQTQGFYLQVRSWRKGDKQVK